MQDECLDSRKLALVFPLRSAFINEKLRANIFFIVDEVKSRRKTVWVLGTTSALKRKRVKRRRRRTLFENGDVVVPAWVASGDFCKKSG